MRMAKSLRPWFLLAAALLLSPLASAERIALDGGASIEPPSRWRPSGVAYRNATQLVVPGKRIVRPPDSDREQEVVSYEAQLMVTSEVRRSHSDALARLSDIARYRDEPARFVEIGGWPAVEVSFVEPEAQRGKDPGEGRYVQKAITAVAVSSRVLRFDISLAVDADLALLREAMDIARSAKFAESGDPAKVKEAIRKLSAAEVARRLEPKRGGLPGASLAPVATAAAGERSGAAVLVQNGVGEIEVATNADATQVVVASNQALAFSTDRATTFAAGNTGTFGLNDPSLSRGATGGYYLAVIAFPNGTPAHLNVNGCANAVSRSTDGGANFGLQGFSAVCPLNNPGICFPDQEHIAADRFTATAAGNDQVYAVWRNFIPAAGVASCRNITAGAPTSSITCSTDNGATWTATAAIPGAGDFPRVAVGSDGAVYVTTVAGNSVLLSKFTSCSSGLNAVAGFPVTVAVMTGNVACPMAGLDRCNSGNTLSSPTPAPDPADSMHLFVAFAERDTAGGERVIVAESRDSGATFPRTVNVSGTTSARRFMPWACSTRGNAYVGWYDRTAATAAGASNDMTDYFFGYARSQAPATLTAGAVRNLTGNADPQCASGWPCAPRAVNDSESCTAQPQLAGVCRNAAGGGSNARCDFSAGGCPPGETCQVGGGCPKYGDYNGIACAGDYVVAAWTSATTPVGGPAGAGLRVFASAEFVGQKIVECRLNIGACRKPERFDRDLLVVKCLTTPCHILDPVPKNCLVKWSCPACPQGGLCPPYVHVVFDDTIRPWDVSLVDNDLTVVEHTLKRYGKNLVLTFRPSADRFRAGEIGDYQLAFSSKPGVKKNVEYKIRAKLLVSDKAEPNLKSSPR